MLRMTLIISVIQTTEGRKNLGDTHFMFSRFFTSFNNTSSLRSE